MEVNASSSDSILGKVTPSPINTKHLSVGNEAVALRSLCLQTHQE